MQELQKRVPFNFGVSTTIFNKNIDDCENILAWAKKEELDIVFNMVRFTRSDARERRPWRTRCKPIGRDEERLRKFFLERVRMDPLLDGQNYIYMHYADMIGNGYHREAPCPFQTQGIMLNPDGGLFFCENSEVVGNVADRGSRGAVFPRSRARSIATGFATTQCPTCLSPCQMNVAAVKQVVPYVKFLVRASREKRRSAATAFLPPQGPFGLTISSMPSSLDTVRVVLFSGGRGSGVLSKQLLKDPQHPADARHQRLRRWRVDRGGAPLSRRQPRAVGFPQECLASGARTRHLPAGAGRDARRPAAGRLDRRTTRVDDHSAATRSALPPVAARVEAFARRTGVDRPAVQLQRLQRRQPGLRRLVPALRIGSSIAAVDDYCALVGLPAGLIENVTDGTNAYLVAIGEDGAVLGSEEEIVDAAAATTGSGKST